MEICLNSKGDKKSRYLQYFMHRIDLLRHYKITPVVVFDGGNIPCKATTEQERYRHVTAFSTLLIAYLKTHQVFFEVMFDFLCGCFLLVQEKKILLRFGNGKAQRR